MLVMGLGARYQELELVLGARYGIVDHLILLVFSTINSHYLLTVNTKPDPTYWGSTNDYLMNWMTVLINKLH